MQNKIYMYRHVSYAALCKGSTTLYLTGWPFQITYAINVTWCHYHCSFAKLNNYSRFKCRPQSLFSSPNNKESHNNFWRKKKKPTARSGWQSPLLLVKLDMTRIIFLTTMKQCWLHVRLCKHYQITWHGFHCFKYRLYISPHCSMSKRGSWFILVIIILHSAVQKS